MVNRLLDLEKTLKAKTPTLSKTKGRTNQQRYTIAAGGRNKWDNLSGTEEEEEEEKKLPAEANAPRATKGKWPPEKIQGTRKLAIAKIIAQEAKKWKDIETENPRSQKAWDILVWTNTLYPKLKAWDLDRMNRTISSLQQRLLKKSVDKKIVENIELYINNRVTAQTKFLERLFMTLEYGNLEYKPSENTGKQWLPYNKAPIPSALSHGGRVIIRVSQSAQEKNEPNLFWNWLVTGQAKTSDERGPINPQAGIFKRTHATHAVKYDVDLGPVEIGKKRPWATAGHYGMNLALGGLFYTNAEEELVFPDGRHGHLYLHLSEPYYDKKKNKDWAEAILVGCEGVMPAGYPKDNKDNDTGWPTKTFEKEVFTVYDGPYVYGTPKPHLHNHLGQAHSTIGTPSKISATGGQKWSAMEIGDDFPGKYGMRVTVDNEVFNKLINLSRDDKQVIEQRVRGILLLPHAERLKRFHTT